MQIERGPESARRRRSLLDLAIDLKFIKKNPNRWISAIENARYGIVCEMERGIGRDSLAYSLSMLTALLSTMRIYGENPHVSLKRLSEEHRWATTFLLTLGFDLGSRQKVDSAYDPVSRTLRAMAFTPPPKQTDPVSLAHATAGTMDVGVFFRATKGKPASANEAYLELASSRRGKKKAEIDPFYAAEMEPLSGTTEKILHQNPQPLFSAYFDVQLADLGSKAWRENVFKEADLMEKAISAISEPDVWTNLLYSAGIFANSFGLFAGCHDPEARLQITKTFLLLGYGLDTQDTVDCVAWDVYIASFLGRFFTDVYIDKDPQTDARMFSLTLGLLTAGQLIRNFNQLTQFDIDSPWGRYIQKLNF